MTDAVTGAKALLGRLNRAVARKAAVPFWPAQYSPAKSTVEPLGIARPALLEFVFKPPSGSGL